MKTIVRYLLLFSCIFSIVATNPSLAQLTKHVNKAAPTISKKSLQNIQSFQPVVPWKSRATNTNPSFVPRQVNAAAHQLNPAIFTRVQYDTKGRLLFTEGVLPNNISLNLKSTNQIEAACFQYLNAISKPLGIKNAEHEFAILDVQTDQQGLNHIKLQQTWQGIPVYGGQAYLHAKNGTIDRFNGFVYPTPSIASAQPTISSNEASQITTNNVALKTKFQNLTPSEQSFLNYTQPIAELVIYHSKMMVDGEHLAWHITVRPNFIERWEYFVDATNGSVIHAYNNTQSDGDVTASGTDLNGVNQTFHTYLENGTYYMVDISKPMFNQSNFEGVIKTYTANNSPYNQIQSAPIVSSSNNTWAANAISAHYHASLSYDYWKTVFNRNSYNGQGGSIPNVINITDENGQGFDNAFWNGAAMYYGNGGSNFKPLAGGLDVCAHELGHAVDETSANLEYQNQSGAINEAFSDIIGSMVERKNWTIGEDVMKPGNPNFPTGVLRDMSDPHNGGTSFADNGYQPAHLSEIYTGDQDNGGVHINSGVVNFAYYKYASAVGLSKGEQTFMKALFNYLTRSSQFIDLRIAVLQAAKDLYGDGSAEMTAAAQAFDQVGVSDGTGSGGSGTTAPGNLPVNPGQDYILLYDLVTSDNNTLYISNTEGTQYQAMSTTEIKNKPSILDNGSVAVFVSDDNKMRVIELSDQPNESIIQADPIWDGVSVSKDGSLISAITTEQDSSIYVYSFEKEQWAQFHLYNPGTQTGTNTFNVLYADAMEWLYDGQYIMYDAYSQINSSSGQSLDYWDINFIRVWDNETNDWGDGQVFKLMTGLQDGVSIGNPSLTKNSTNIAAFDMFDANTNTDYILAVDLDKGEIGEVYNNGSTLGTPNYSKLDDKLIFTTHTNSQDDIAVIGMQNNKIQPSGNPSALIPEAKWGIWFAQGTRSLGMQDPSNGKKMVIYPNPSKGKPIIQIEGLQANTVQVDLYDLQGRRVYSEVLRCSGSKISPDFSALGAGLYLLRATGNNLSVSGKVTIEY